MEKKNSSIKKVLLNSGIYSVTSILQKAIGFILLPLYTLYLTPDDYGIIGIVNSFTALLTLFYTLSLNGAVQRYYYIYGQDKEKIKSFYGTIIMFVLANSIILTGIIVLFHDFLITPFVEGVSFYPYIFIGVVTVIFNPIYTIYQSLLQTMQKGKKFGVNSLLHFIILVFFNILFIVIFKLGAIGQLFSYLVTGILFGVMSIVSLIRNKVINTKFRLNYLKEALSYSVPLLPHLMSSSIASFISRLFLNNQISVGSAGLFNIASQFMLVIDTLQASVNSAYIPWFYSEMDKDKNERNKIINFADLISKGYLILSIGLSFFIKEVLQIFLPLEYLISWTIIPIMVVAYQFKSIYLFYVNTLFYNTKSTKFIFIASVAGSLVNITISAVFTKKIGLITPAVAILVQWFVTTLIVIAMSKKIEPVKFKLGKMFSYILVLVLSIIIGQFKDFMNPVGEITLMNFIYKIIVFLIVAIILLNKDLPIALKFGRDFIKNRKSQK